MTMVFLSIFWRTLGVLERRFFVLKSCARKVPVIMARCGPNLLTSRVLFSFLKLGQITSLALKMERKNRCLGGLRMEDQHKQSPHTFLVNDFSFLQPRQKQDDRCAFKCVLNTDRGQSPHTFLVNDFSFLQPQQKQDDRCAFKCVLNTDREFKAAAWTSENNNGNVQYKFEV